MTIYRFLNNSSNALLMNPLESVRPNQNDTAGTVRLLLDSLGHYNPKTVKWKVEVEPGMVSVTFTDPDENADG